MLFVGQLVAVVGWAACLRVDADSLVRRGPGAMLPPYHNISVASLAFVVV